MKKKTYLSARSRPSPQNIVKLIFIKKYCGKKSKNVCGARHRYHYTLGKPWRVGVLRGWGGSGRRRCCSARLDDCTSAQSSGNDITWNNCAGVPLAAVVILCHYSIPVYFVVYVVVYTRFLFFIFCSSKSSVVTSKTHIVSYILYYNIIEFNFVFKSSP